VTGIVSVATGTTGTTEASPLARGMVITLDTLERHNKGETYDIDRQEKNETGPDKKDGIPYPGSMA